MFSRHQDAEVHRVDAEAHHDRKQNRRGDQHDAGQQQQQQVDDEQELDPADAAVLDPGGHRLGQGPSAFPTKTTRRQPFGSAPRISDLFRPAVVRPHKARICLVFPQWPDLSIYDAVHHRTGPNRAATHPNTAINRPEQLRDRHGFLREPEPVSAPAAKRSRRFIRGNSG
jgi:hypothetical protein